MNTHDKIELPAEFRSGNDIPVTQATIKRERMEEILRDAIEADRKHRGDPVAWAMFADNGNIRIWARKPMPHPDCVPLYTSPQPVDPVKLDRYDAGYLGGQDGLPAHVWHDIIRSELDRAYDFYMDQLNRATPQPTEPVKVPSDGQIMEAVVAYGTACRQPNITAAELEMRRHGIRALLARYGIRE